MGFDLVKFKKAKLIQRTETVKVPELKDWFPEGEEAVLLVRGLTGEEFYQVRQASAKRADLQAIASRVMSGEGAAIADAIEDFFGAVPEEFARRVEVLIHGCVDPVLTREEAMKLFRHFPSTAHTIADAILRATGEGSIVGEPKGCGEIPASDTTYTSATCGENASLS